MGSGAASARPGHVQVSDRGSGLFRNEVWWRGATLGPGATLPFPGVCPPSAFPFYSLRPLLSLYRFKGVVGLHSICSLGTARTKGRSFSNSIKKGKGERVTAGGGALYHVVLVPRGDEEGEPGLGGDRASPPSGSELSMHKLPQLWAAPSVAEVVPERRDHTALYPMPSLRPPSIRPQSSATLGVTDDSVTAMLAALAALAAAPQDYEVGMHHQGASTPRVLLGAEMVRPASVPLHQADASYPMQHAASSVQQGELVDASRKKSVGFE